MAQYGDTLTYTAAVNPQATGTIDLTIDAGTPAEVTQTVAPTNGVATFDIAGLVLGTHLVTATYSGNDAFKAATGSITQLMTVRTTVTTVTSSQNPTMVGDSVTLTAAVTAPGSNLTPTGMVEFAIDNSPDAAVTELVPLDSNGVATLETSNLLVGAHSVVVTYPNSAPFGGSVGNLTQNVGRVNTTLALTRSRAGTAWGQSVTFTATLSSQSAQGAIDFIIDGKLAVHGLVDATGVARMTSSTLGVGKHTVVAKYAGTPLNTPATSTPLTHTVTMATTRVTLTSNRNPSTYLLTKVTFTAVVRVVAPGVGTPTGNVQFWLDTNTLLGVAPLVHGKAGLATSSLLIGRHTVTAKYMGNKRTFLPSSASVTQRVL
jgi:hypothetical protein